MQTDKHTSEMEKTLTTLNPFLVAEAIQLQTCVLFQKVIIDPLLVMQTAALKASSLAVNEKVKMDENLFSL